MDNRLKLHNKLVDILGTEKVYYQPPTNFKIGHPCIVYELSRIDGVFANNERYKNMKRYNVTLIHTDPVSPIIDEILSMQFSSFDTFYTADTLNHYAYTIYHK